MRVIGCPTWASLQDYSLKEYTALAGVVVSIAGLAMCFFAGSVLQGVAFGVLFAVTITCFYYMRKFDDLDDLAKTSGALRKTQQAFTTAQKAWEVSNKALHEEAAHLKTTVSQLQQAADSLARDNRGLEETQQGLRATVDRLGQDNMRLEGNNTRLQAHVEGLRRVVATVHEQVDQFNIQNGRLAESLGIFTGEMSVLQEHNAAFDATVHELDVAIHQDTARLVDAIRTGQTMSVQLMTALREQNTRLEQDIKRLSTLLQAGHFSRERLEELQRLIVQAERDSADKRRQLEQMTVQLIAIEERVRNEGAAMGGVRQGLVEESERLEEKRRELAELERRYQQILLEFQKLVPMLQAQVSRLEA